VASVVARTASSVGFQVLRYSFLLCSSRSSFDMGGEDCVRRLPAGCPLFAWFGVFSGRDFL